MSSAALDLASSQPPGSESQPATTRQRFSEQTFPTSVLNSLSSGQTTPSTSGTQKSPDVFGGRQMNRHSMEASLAAYTKSSLPNQFSSASDAARPGNIHPSYSTNDVPTLKNNRMSATDITPPKTNAQQQFHNHNASLGRIPAGAMSNRQSRDLSGDTRREETTNNNYQQMNSMLQASAPSFNTPATVASPSESATSQMSPFGMVNTFQNQPFYGNYGMPFMGLNNMGNPVVQQQMQMFQGPNGLLNFNGANATFGSVNRVYDSQTRVMQQRRMQSNDEHTRFNNVQLETLRGEILSLCKDQHGCRYLQKKLEERNADNLEIIFAETNQHVVELMTDPFGNYLCQKLLEFSNDDQRTQLIHNAAPEMVKIALNSHGTRALQKMIEFISTSEQTQAIINALKDRVVELIQDLNGNHVIQKCLNRLTPQDAQVCT